MRDLTLLWIISARIGRSLHDYLMFMRKEPLQWPEAVATSAMPKSLVNEMESKDWWRPMNGHLVSPAQAGTYVRQHDRYLGYVLALSRQRPRSIVFAGTVAAMLLGHPVWPALTHVDVYMREGRRNLRELRPHPGTAKPVTMRPMGVPDDLSVLDVGHGVLVTSHEQTAVDVARLAASQTAFVTVCSILGALSTTGDIYQDRTDSLFLEQEAAARARMIGIAEKLGKTSGRRRAMRIIELASGQVESVAEARVLWIIRAFGLPDPIMQYRIMVGRDEFFGDFVWPELKLIVEFNGQTKYDGEGGRDAKERARETLLRSAGYEIINLEWHQLKDPGKVALLIYGFLTRRASRVSRGSSAGVPAPAPIAYPSLRPDLNQPARKFRKTTGR
ncbi:MAG: DUF559 domain-containing protein [Ancrocorticia sp.]